jgi:Photosynthesis system II assembly factor YCF48/Putative zinc-finger
MEQLPKIVRRHLQGPAKPAAHPDPDLLTAFAERSLKSRERSQVLQHLAECSDCRDVLSVAMPELESASSQGPERSRWLSWPVLRWGALAACAVVVSAAVTLHYERGQELEPSRADKAPAAPASLESELSKQPGQKLAANLAPPAPVQSERDIAAAGKLSKSGEKTADTGTMAGRAAASVPPVLALDQGKKIQEPANNPVTNLEAILSADRAAGAAPAVAPMPLSAAKTVGTEPENKVRNGAMEYSTRAGKQTVIAEAGPAPAPERAQPAEQKAKDESPRNESQKEVQAVRGGAIAAPLGDRKADALSAETAQTELRSRTGDSNVPRWTISADGALQRSFDSGKTWHTIPVASGVVFRALAANDSDIWVGGAAGVLYHSSDAGQHWARIQPVADGKSLTADIATVEFSDAQHGKLTTSNRETWTTSDAGDTWQSK